MNNPLNFSPSELLSVWLDGELDPVHEAQLFSRLAASTELRREMRELLAIHQEIDTAKFYPPAHLKAAAMSKAGLGDKLFLGGFFNAALPAAGKMLVHGGLMAIGSALTLLFMTIMAPKQEAGKDSKSPAAVQAPALTGPAANSGMPSESIAGMTGSRNDMQPLKDKAYKSRKYAAAPSAKSASAASSDALAPKEEPGTEQNSERTNIDIAETRLQQQEPYMSVGRNNSFPEAPVSVTDPDRSAKNFSVGVRGMAMRSYPAPITSAQADPFFNNMSVSMLYMLDENQRLGIEIGQEAFSQDYSGTEMSFAGLRQFHYRQNTLLLWAGAFYELAPAISGLDFVKPLGRITLGGSDAGMIGRFIVGTEFSADSRTRFTLGLEGTALLYSHQQKLFIAPKLGISYGVSVGF